MNNKITHNESGEISGNITKEPYTHLNLFPESREVKVETSKFPDWDITPPDQFINPRVKLRQ